MKDNGNLSGTYVAQMQESGVVGQYVWQQPDLLRKLEALYDGVRNGGLDDLEEEVPEESS